MVKIAFPAWFYGVLVGTYALGISFTDKKLRLVVGPVLPLSRHTLGVAWGGKLRILAGYVPKSYSKLELIDTAVELACRTRSVAALLAFDVDFKPSWLPKESETCLSLSEDFIRRVIRIYEGTEAMPARVQDPVRTYPNVDQLSDQDRAALTEVVKALIETRPKYRYESVSTRKSIENIKRLKRTGNFDATISVHIPAAEVPVSFQGTGTSTVWELKALKDALNP